MQLLAIGLTLRIPVGRSAADEGSVTTAHVVQHERRFLAFLGLDPNAEMLGRAGAVDQDDLVACRPPDLRRIRTQVMHVPDRAAIRSVHDDEPGKDRWNLFFDDHGVILGRA